MITSSRYLDKKFSEAMMAGQMGDIRSMRRIAHEMRQETGQGRLQEGLKCTADNIDAIADRMKAVNKEDGIRNND